ncbi:MAG: HAMP domain-containing sensor histidine kinase, partial [Candidatus Poribacteria bacterium]
MSPARRPRKALVSALIGVGLVAAALSGLSASWEARQRRHGLEQLFATNAGILTGVLGFSGVQNARAYDGMRTLLADGLDGFLDALHERDQHEPLTDEKLREIRRLPGFFRVYVVDADGTITAGRQAFGRGRRPGADAGGGGSSIRGRRPGAGGGEGGASIRGRRGPGPTPGEGPPPFAGRRWPLQDGDQRPLRGRENGPRFEFRVSDHPEIQQVLRGEAEYLTVGFEGWRGGQMTAAVRRRARGGAIVAVVQAEEMIRLRASAGREGFFERLMGEEPGIVAVGWETENVSEPRDGEEFTWHWDELDGLTTFVGTRTLRGFDGNLAQVSVTLDAQPFRTIQRAAWTQGLSRAGLVALVFIGASVMFFARQNVQLLTTERDRIQDEVYRLEEESRRREKLTAMGELAAGVAHEIRSPLNAMSMASQRLAREFQPPGNAEDYAELIDTLKSQSTRVEQVIDQFLRFARPPKMAPVPGDLAELARDVASRMAPTAEAQGVALDVEVPGRLPHDFDPIQFSQVIENLVRNALEAQPDGGTIWLGLTTDTDKTILTVTDDGPGVPDELLARVFDLYYTS